MKKSNSARVCCSMLNIVLLIVVVWLGFLCYLHFNPTIRPVNFEIVSIQKTLTKVDIQQNSVDQVSSNIESAPKLALKKEDHSTAPKLILKIEEDSTVNEVKDHLRKKVIHLLDDTKIERKSIHIAFSTDCSFFQDWQTLLVFNSAAAVKQRGRITRVASGCSSEKKKELTKLYEKLYPQHSVHFTPDFKTDGGTKKK